MQVLATLKYTKQREVGVGQGMNSKVYLSNDEQLGGVVAVKEIPKNGLGNALEEYFAEAKAMFQTRHRNVVPVQYACATETHVCLAMPYCPGKSLLDRLVAGPLPILEVFRVAQSILNGLAHIHSKRVIHLDLKPSNILFDADDEAMVSDFGQSRRISAEGIATVPRMYRNSFPPEALANKAVSVHSDIFQMGLLLYRAFNGEPVYREQANSVDVRVAIPSGKFPDRDFFLPHVPKRVRTVIRKALAVKPQDRYSTATHLADALGRVPVKLNWSMTYLPNGEVEWACSRGRRNGLLVRLLVDGESTWKVECFRRGANGKLRAYGKRVLWKKGLRRKASLSHLKGLFEALEQV